MRRIRTIIAGIYSRPPATVIVGCTVLACAGYFVLPPVAGLPLIVLGAALPWIEERLGGGGARQK